MRNQMSSKDHRTEEDYARDFAKGNQTEQTFMDIVGANGGSAGKIGHNPKVRWPQPRMSHPAPDDSVQYFVAPDIFFVPRPGAQALLAEVKLKTLLWDDGAPYFWLDECALHQLNKAQRYFGPTILAVSCDELSSIDTRFEDFAIVQVADLQPDRVELLKRYPADKPAFMLPLDLFSPLSSIFTEEFRPDAHHTPLFRHAFPPAHDERRTRADPRDAGAARRKQAGRRHCAGSASNDL